MSETVARLAVFLLAACQITAGSSHMQQRTKVPGVFVNVNGSDYYIDKNLVSRAESKTLCESLNMTLISFETAEKWNMISNWTFANDYQDDWFWTGGIRKLGQSDWIWESTGAKITDFFWQRDQPSIVNPVMNTCVDFVTAYLGWDDDYCDFFILNTMCQNI